MSCALQFRATLEVTAQSENLVTAWAIEHLESQGYHVAAPNEQWETLSAFMARIGLLNYDSFHSSLRIWEARGHRIPQHRSPTQKRLVELVSNPAFDAFCVRNKIAKTESLRSGTARSEVASAAASEGPDRPAHKPLMRKPRAHDGASPTGHTERATHSIA